jgi:colicin import membrane protein
MPALTAAERLAKLQAEQIARDKEMESLKTAAEEEEQAAEAAKKAEEERLATERKVAKKAEEATLVEEAEGRGAPPKKKSKGKAEVVDEEVEVVESPTDAAITLCRR